MRTAALALVAALLPAQASACHHFRYWNFRTPQRCGANLGEQQRYRSRQWAPEAKRGEARLPPSAEGTPPVLPSLDDEAERRAEALEVLQEKLMELKR